MRKGLVLLIVVLGVLVGGYAFAHYWGSGHGYGGHMMGRGWDGHMMGPAYGGNCWGNPGAFTGEKAVTEKDAENIARNYIGANPNLKVGKIEDKETHFEAQILTKEGSLVTRLGIDKNTGSTRPLY